VSAKAETGETETRTRDAAGTRRRVLESALEEFTAKGFAGARVESVAERAGVNVKTLYKYYGSKEGLYEAVFGDTFSTRHNPVFDTLEAMAADAHAARTLLPALHDLLASNPAFARLMAWDALSVDANDPQQTVVAADARAHIYAREIDLIKQAQRVNGLWPGLDADLILVAAMGLAIYPHITAPLTGMITGIPSDSPEFRVRWNDFLGRLSELLAQPQGAPATVGALPDAGTNTNRLLRMGGRALARHGLVTAFGHASVRLDADAFLVTAPMPLGLIQQERGTVVPIKGELPDGVLGEVRAHQAIYAKRADVEAVVRVQPPGVRTLSALGRTPRALDGNGSYFAPAPPLWDDPQLIRDDRRAKQLATQLGKAPAIVMRGNGAVVTGSSLPQAVALAWFLEEAARTELAVLSTGQEPQPLSTREASQRAVWTGGILERTWAYLTHGDPEA
jgi:HCOMODA/2-hydroxy-3-carboxy-muconic semialdehyde decarboxylase